MIILLVLRRALGAKNHRLTEALPDDNQPPQACTCGETGASGQPKSNKLKRTGGNTKHVTKHGSTKHLQNLYTLMLRQSTWKVPPGCETCPNELFTLPLPGDGFNTISLSLSLSISCSDRCTSVIEYSSPSRSEDGLACFCSATSASWVLIALEYWWIPLWGGNKS